MLTSKKRKLKTLKELTSGQLLGWAILAISGIPWTQSSQSRKKILANMKTRFLRQSQESEFLWKSSEEMWEKALEIATYIPNIRGALDIPDLPTYKEFE